MAESGAPDAILESDYEALLAALTETARGRWFLEEFLRRQQKPDTQIVLEAIARLEKTITRQRTVPSIDRIRLDIADMQEAIERTKREIANIKHESEDGNRFVEASNELDAIVSKTESATQEILAAAEAIQEHAWSLREAGADDSVCDDIDARATEIFMACSFQDLTGQRTQKIVTVLKYLESRINMMISIWGIEDASGDDHPIVEDTRPDAHLLNGPQLDGRGVSQDTVDRMLGAAGMPAEDRDEANGDPETEADGMDAGAAAQTISEADLDALFASDDSDAAADPGADSLDIAAFEAGEIDIDALFAAEADADIAARADDMQDDLPAADPFDDLELVDAGSDDLELVEAAPAVADDLAAHRARLQDRLASDEGDDPLDQLSPGERQALFS